MRLWLAHLSVTATVASACGAAMAAPLPQAFAVQLAKSAFRSAAPGGNGDTAAFGAAGARLQAYSVAVGKVVSGAPGNPLTIFNADQAVANLYTAEQSCASSWSCVSGRLDIAKTRSMLEAGARSLRSTTARARAVGPPPFVSVNARNHFRCAHPPPSLIASYRGFLSTTNRWATRLSRYAADAAHKKLSDFRSVRQFIAPANGTGRIFEPQLATAANYWAAALYLTWYNRLTPAARKSYPLAHGFASAAGFICSY